MRYGSINYSVYASELPCPSQGCGEVCADMTNDQCWEMLVVKADAGGWRRQSVFTDQLFCQTQDVRVGKARERRGGDYIQTVGVDSEW